jgi:hypothetical protein
MFRPSVSQPFDHPVRRQPAPEAPLRPLETALVVATAAVFLLVVFQVILWRGSPILLYVQDPAAVFAFTPLAGFISHLGVFALFAAGAICVFSSFHVAHRFGLLFWVGLFSMVIAADDFFMVHEVLAPRVGVPELAVFGIYGLSALAILVRFRRLLSGKGHMALYLATLLLAGSVLLDLALEYSDAQVIAEDSLKFVGLMLWSAYWLRRAHLAMAGRWGAKG